MQRPTGPKPTMAVGNAGAVNKPPVGKPTGKLMRLRCRLRPLFENYHINDQISEKDCDVTFECQGGSVRAHKVILSIASKFFCQIFQDQKPHKPTVVHTPDISVNTMQMILHLCYKDHLVLPMKAMKDLGNYLSVFGLAWDQFNFSEVPPSKLTTPTFPQASSRGAVQPKQVTSTATAISQAIIKSNKGSFAVGGKIISGPIVATDSFNLGNSSQNYVFKQKKSEELTEAEHNAIEMQKHKIAYAKQIGKFQQPRPILPKPTGLSQQFQYRAANGPPVLQRMSVSNSEMHMLSQDTPGIEVDVDDNQDGDEPADSPEAQKMLNLWMESVGKSEGCPPKLPRSAASPVKRRSSPAASSPLIKMSKRQCSVCTNTFEDDAKWRWHEERHVGINLFKCTMCPSIFTTSRKVYQHEMMEHGLIGTFDDNTGSNLTTETQSRTNTQMDGNLDPNSRVTMVTTQYGTHYRRLPDTSPKRNKLVPVRKYKQAHYSKLHNNFSSRNPAIGIGVHEGGDLIESRKLKQLHWLYICSQCDACSDSSAKAIAHYRLCFPGREKKYEETVVKFRQGFYGKIKCCLCPRRYTSLAGFLIHCGHMHQDYRQLFSHISSEDKMICVNCRSKFESPASFQAHLNMDQRCDRPTKEDSGMLHSLLAQDHDSSSNPSFEDARKSQYTKLLGTNPRSARLQNRLAAVTACFEDDPVDEETFTPVACPICGEAEVSSLTDHLHSSHSELDIRVERIEETSLRCKACGITFVICDLLAHNNSCTGSKGLHYLSQRKTSLGGGSARPPKPKMVIEYPPGIGTSPLDTMEEEDLMSIEVLRKALKCGVCKRVGKKMNVVAECLRTHGVYRCAICFNSYLSKEQNSLHLRKCHTNSAGRLTCPICKIVRSNAGQLTSHIYTTHWLPLLKESAVDTKRDKLLIQMQGSGDTSVNSGIDSEDTLNDSLDASVTDENDTNTSGDELVRSSTNLSESLEEPSDGKNDGVDNTINEKELTANGTDATAETMEENDELNGPMDDVEPGATDDAEQAAT